MTDKAYPDLPLADYWGSQASPEDLPLYTADQMRAYVDADRASRNAPATVGEIRDLEAVAVARYKVVPAHSSLFWSHAVVAGDGTQQLYTGREVECQNMAAKFTGAFLDGAFLALRPRNAAGSGISEADIDRIVPALAPIGEDFPAEWALWKDRERIRTELRALLAMAPTTTQAQEAVAYLDIGAGGYMDLGTELTEAQLAALPKGRHMLKIAGTYGVDGYQEAAPTQADSAPPSAPGDEAQLLADAIADLDLALAFTDKARSAAQEGESVTGTGVWKDAREWLESAARKVIAAREAMGEAKS